MDNLEELEKKIQLKYQDTLKPLAKLLAVDLSRTDKDAPRLPLVLFLGNHSSGKSTFINYLIGEDRQKTGLAPTDDGFTILTSGKQPNELDGQSALSDPALALTQLEKLGPDFLSRFRLKMHPAKILESVNLVDSPGMIDAATEEQGRGYDFSSSVREFAEMADLILFFFDPDKPGTTGETVSIFNQRLAGLEHKLLIILNKVDLFDNIRDFARTYGALCWNLSKTMRTKDVPHIFNTYVPQEGQPKKDASKERLSLEDFDKSREEIVAEIHRAPTRRAHNLVSNLLQESRRLSMHARVGEVLVQEIRCFRRKFYLGAFLFLVAGAVGAYFTWDNPDQYLRTGIAVISILLTLGMIYGGKFFTKWKAKRMGKEEALDPYFEKVFRAELTWQDRSDLRAQWGQVRSKLYNSIILKGVDHLPSGRSFNKQLQRVEVLIDKEIPELREKIRAVLDR